MIVADTSVTLAALLGHDPSRRALSGRRLLAPHLIDAELAHAVRGLVLGGKLGEADAARLLAAWPRLALDRLPMRGLLPRVWELRANLTAYDALFVAAAEAHDVPLVSSDRRLALATGPRCPIELVAATAP